MSRPTNKELCEAFRKLLTHDFNVNRVKVLDRSGGYTDLDVTREVGLKVTKDWRNQVWKAFREIEDRLLPLNVVDREKELSNDKSDKQD